MSQWYSEYYKRKNVSVFEKPTIGPEKEKKEIIKESELKPTIIPSKILVEYPKQVKKSYIFLGTFLLIMIVFLILFSLTKPSFTSKYNPLDASVSNSTGLYSTFYYHNKPLFYFSGWESKLSYSGKEEPLYGKEEQISLKTSRLFGKEDYKKLVFDEFGNPFTILTTDNSMILEPLTKDPSEVTKIGWFTNSEEIFISEVKLKNKKQIKVLLSDDKSEIKRSSLYYYFYKNKPYFKVQFAAENVDSSKIKDFSYGFLFSNFDIYQSNGRILENDNQIITLDRQLDILIKDKNLTLEASSYLKAAISKDSSLINKKSILRKGSEYNFNSEFQIFINKNKTLAIIEFGEDVIYFKNSFYWNVFWAQTPYQEEGAYSPVYFIVIENPVLSFENGEWQLTSKQYSGSINSYIQEILIQIMDLDFEDET